jgi:hypothetical protein
MLATASLSKADTFGTFDLNYSGASFGNAATATGQIVIDETLLPNPGTASGSFSTYLQSLNLTVFGAASGNGTFSLSDFGTFVWNTNGATLDLTQELVGQATPGSPWGTTGGGDFNLFASNPIAPEGVAPFTLQTNGGSGDQLALTNFTPANTPEPQTYALMLFGMLGAAGFALQRRYSQASKAA